MKLVGSATAALALVASSGMMAPASGSPLSQFIDFGGPIAEALMSSTCPNPVSATEQELVAAGDSCVQSLLPIEGAALINALACAQALNVDPTGNAAQQDGAGFELQTEKLQKILEKGLELARESGDAKALGVQIMQSGFWTELYDLITGCLLKDGWLEVLDALLALETKPEFEFSLATFFKGPTFTETDFDNVVQFVEWVAEQTSEEPVTQTRRLTATHPVARAFVRRVLDAVRVPAAHADLAVDLITKAAPLKMHALGRVLETVPAGETRVMFNIPGLEAGHCSDPEPVYKYLPLEALTGNLTVPSGSCALCEVLALSPRPDVAAEDSLDGSILAFLLAVRDDLVDMSGKVDDFMRKMMLAVAGSNGPEAASMCVVTANDEGEKSTRPNTETFFMGLPDACVAAADELEHVLWGAVSALVVDEGKLNSDCDTIRNYPCGANEPFLPLMGSNVIGTLYAPFRDMFSNLLIENKMTIGDYRNIVDATCVAKLQLDEESAASTSRPWSVLAATVAVVAALAHA